MKATGRKAGTQTTYYMTRVSERHRRNADYSALALRDHDQIAEMVNRIDREEDENEQEQLRMQTGINGKVCQPWA